MCSNSHCVEYFLAGVTNRWNSGAHNYMEIDKKLNFLRLFSLNGPDEYPFKRASCLLGVVCVHQFSLMKLSSLVEGEPELGCPSVR